MKEGKIVSPVVLVLLIFVSGAQVFAQPEYVGSSNCYCHAAIQASWGATLHHIMIQDTSGILTQEASGVSVFDPSAPGYDTYVDGVFPSTPPIDDVTYTIGSHWKQRYLKDMGGDEYAILPAQWVVKTQDWGAYHASDWDAEGRRWGKKCAGCHTTGYEPSGVNTLSGTFSEMGIGCEACHGPGSDHVNSMDPADIVNPEDLAFDRANEVCGGCHYRGSSSGGYYGFAWNETDDSRFLPGEVLADHITESPGLWPDGMTSTKHHQQWVDWKSSVHSLQDVGCFSCHDPHADTEYGHQLRLDNDDNSLCTSCHTEMADPAAATAHTHHSYDPENQNETGGASRCSKCHMPKVAKSATSYDIHSHTFEAISPQETIDYQAAGGMPNSCAVSCHRNPSYANVPDFGITDAELTDWTEDTDMQLAQLLADSAAIWWPACAGEIGDVTGDGDINVMDVLAVVNHILGIVPITDPNTLCRADCNGDGDTNILDALGIVNVILGIGQCGPAACKAQLTFEVMEFLRSLEPYLSAEDFARFLALVKVEVDLPAEYSLAQNYPNPFNPGTAIEYALPWTARIKLSIYNVLGQEVKVLVNSEMEGGYHTVSWDGKDAFGQDVASGVYFYRLDAGQFTQTRKMMLLK
ncbi:MAG: T9SS type A sorting domain-containing protein [bacterium]